MASLAYNSLRQLTVGRHALPTVIIDGLGDEQQRKQLEGACTILLLPKTMGDAEGFSLLEVALRHPAR